MTSWVHLVNLFILDSGSPPVVHGPLVGHDVIRGDPQRLEEMLRFKSWEVHGPKRYVKGVHGDEKVETPLNIIDHLINNLKFASLEITLLSLLLLRQSITI